MTSAVQSPAAGAPLAMGYVHRDFAAAGTAVSIASGDADANAVVSRLPIAATAAAVDPHPPVAR